jgi:hypothetical protein
MEPHQEMVQEVLLTNKEETPPMGAEPAWSHRRRDSVTQLEPIHVRFAFDETEALVETIGRLTRRPGREIDGDRTE